MELLFTKIAKTMKGVFWEERVIRSSVLGMLSLLCLVEIQVEMLNKEMYR